MKNLLSIPVALFFLISSAKAIDNRDSLLKEYHQQDSLFQKIQEEDFKQGISISLRQKQIAKQLQGDTLIIKSAIHYGETLSFLGIFDESLKELYAVLKIAVRIHDQRSEGTILSRIARDYQSLADYKQSSDFFIKSTKVLTDAGCYDDTLFNAYEIGFNEVVIGEDEKGMNRIKRTLETAKKIMNDEAIVWGLDNISNLLANRGDYKQALAYELELFNYPNGWNSNYKKTALYEHLSEIYVLLKDWPNAKKYQALCFENASKIKSNDWLFECYKLQSLIDEGTGDYRSSLTNHKKYLELKDSVYQANYDTKVSAMSALYDLETKQGKILLLEKNNELQQGKIRQQQFQRNAIIVGAVLLLALLLFLARLIHQSKTQRLQRQFSKELINVQENERQNISKELHDNVGQNILFVKNSLMKSMNAEIANPLISTIDNALEEVRNISKDLYPNQLEKYGLASAVDDMAERIQEVSSIFVSTDLEQVDAHLSKNVKINLYRIVQEAVNNILKYADASAIRISGILHKGRIELCIQDNGKGFDKSILEKKGQRHFGILNMEERMKLLNGKFYLETALNKGTKLNFWVPL